MKLPRILFARKEIKKNNVHVLWYSCERMVETDMKAKNCWIKSLFFVFFAPLKYSRSFVKLMLNHWSHMDYFNDVLTTFLGLECYVSVVLLSMEGQKALRLHPKYLNLCSEEEKVLWVWNDMKVSN